MTQQLFDQLSKKFFPLTSATIDCDGKTQIIHTILCLSGIRHQCKGGRVVVLGEIIAPHFWIEIDDLIIDYSLHQWVNCDVPVGIFNRNEHPLIQFIGDNCDILFLSKPLFFATQMLSCDPIIPYDPVEL